MRRIFMATVATITVMLLVAACVSTTVPSAAPVAATNVVQPSGFGHLFPVNHAIVFTRGTSKQLIEVVPVIATPPPDAPNQEHFSVTGQPFLLGNQIYGSATRYHTQIPGESLEAYIEYDVNGNPVGVWVSSRDMWSWDVDPLQ